MTYRIATNPNGEKRWWTAEETIPADHTDVRAATAEEAPHIAAILAGNAAFDEDAMDAAAAKLHPLLAA